MMDVDEAAEYFDAGMANVVDSELKVIYFMQMDFADIVESLVTHFWVHLTSIGIRMT